MTARPHHFHMPEKNIQKLRDELAEKTFCLADITVDSYAECPARDDVIVMHANDSALVSMMWVRRADQLPYKANSTDIRIRLTMGERLTRPKPVTEDPQPS